MSLPLGSTMHSMSEPMPTQSSESVGTGGEGDGGGPDSWRARADGSQREVDDDKRGPYDSGTVERREIV